MLNGTFSCLGLSWSLWGEAAVTLQEILAIDVVLIAVVIVLVWSGWHRWQDK
jgi:hypothetical protein